MYITPQKFAEYLKNSTLSPTEQRNVLKLLPSLTAEQIQELGKVFMDDVEEQQEVLQDHEQKRDQLLLKFSIEMEQLKNE
jgi:hypothetical protein